MAAGPWFTVRHQDDDWQPLGQIWLSDGVSDGPAVVEARIRLARNRQSPSPPLPSPPLPSPSPVAHRAHGGPDTLTGETP
jgi:hypothetical protein